MDKFTQINLVLKDYFELNASVKQVLAKDMMPYFVLAGIFKKDEKNGLPIQNLLRKLDEKNQLNIIPYLFADRKKVYTKWYQTQAKKVAERTKQKLIESKMQLNFVYKIFNSK